MHLRTDTDGDEWRLMAIHGGWWINPHQTWLANWTFSHCLSQRTLLESSIESPNTFTPSHGFTPCLHIKITGVISSKQSWHLLGQPTKCHPDQLSQPIIPIICMVEKPYKCEPQKVECPFGKNKGPVCYTIYQYIYHHVSCTYYITVAKSMGIPGS